MIQIQTGETISSNFAVHFYLSLRQKIAFLRILPYTFALFYRRNSPFFISTVHLLSFLRRNFTFLHFSSYICAFLYGGISLFPFPRRTLAPFPSAEFYLSSFLTVHLRLSLRRNFTFSISLPYTCALLYGRNSFFYFPTLHLLSFLRQKFIFSFPCRTLTLFSTAEIRLSSFSTVHLRLTLRQEFIFSVPGRTLTLFSTAGFHLPWLSAQNHCRKFFLATSCRIAI